MGVIVFKFVFEIPVPMRRGRSSSSSNSTICIWCCTAVKEFFVEEYHNFCFFFLFLLILFELVSKYILLICLAWARAEWKALLLVRCSSYVACHRVRRHSDVMHTERMTACGGTDNILMHFAYPNAMLILWDEHTWECYDWLNII